MKLTADSHTLRPGQATTLTVAVSANPGGGGVPSGTVNFMLGSTLLAKITLMPTSATESTASLPLSASQIAARRQHANRSVLGEFDRAVLSCIRTAGSGLRKRHLGANHRDEEAR